MGPSGSGRQRLGLVEMGRRFHAASGQPCGFDPVSFLSVMEEAERQGGLFRSERGFLAGILSRAWCDSTWIYAVELAWWSEDGHGLRLLRRFEDWARDAGAREIRMTTLNAIPRTGLALERRGYTASETSWLKVV